MGQSAVGSNGLGVTQGKSSEQVVTLQFPQSGAAFSGALPVTQTFMIGALVSSYGASILTRIGSTRKLTIEISTSSWISDA